MKKYRYPVFIYESLPYCYLAMGSVAMAVHYYWVTLVSGLILVFAGLAIAMMRYQYRKPIKLADAADKLLQGIPRSALNIKWNSSFECGQTTIDQQHQELFRLGKKVLRALATHQQPEDIDGLLADLIDHIQFHFRIEETLFAELNRPITPEHQQTHQQLLTNAHQLQQKYRRNRVMDKSELINFIVFDLIYEHIVAEVQYIHRFD